MTNKLRESKYCQHGSRASETDGLRERIREKMREREREKMREGERVGERERKSERERRRRIPEGGDDVIIFHSEQMLQIVYLEVIP